MYRGLVGREEGGVGGVGGEVRIPFLWLRFGSPWKVWLQGRHDVLEGGEGVAFGRGVVAVLPVGVGERGAIGACRGEGRLGQRGAVDS